jgi:2-dehydropantoate 2-reductase
MRAGIVGGGGVGGYLGARLKLAGHDVGILARGSNLAALRERGLHLKSPLGEAQTGPLEASADPREIGPVDALFMTTKLYDLEAVASMATALVGPDTLVIPVQNGVEAHEILTRALPGAAVLKATIYISSFLIAPGEILHKSPFCRLRLAPTRPADEDGARRLALVLSGVPGIEAAVSPDIDLDLWQKFVMLASFAAVACVARAPVGQVLDDPALLTRLKAAMAETIAVARAKGIALSGDIESRALTQLRQFPPGAKPSMLEDMDAGRPLELDYLSGAIVRFGKALGVPTPVHEAAYRWLSSCQPAPWRDRS